MPRRHFAVVVDHDHGSLIPMDIELAIEMLLLGKGNKNVKVTAIAAGERLHERLAATNPCTEMLNEADKIAGARLTDRYRVIYHFRDGSTQLYEHLGAHEMVGLGMEQDWRNITGSTVEVEHA